MTYSYKHLSTTYMNSLALQKDPAPPKSVFDRGLTTHYSDRCWVKNPELRAKYALRQMKPRGSNRNLRGGLTTGATEAVELDS